MGVGEGATSMLRKAARKMVVAACASFSRKQDLVDPPVFGNNISNSSVMSLRKRENFSESVEETESANNVTSKNLCAICLDPLSYSTSSSPGQAIFTAQCSHAFHFTCIASNVRHGSVTCPICRAHWTQLPRNLNSPFSLSCNQTDPILRILDDSIATFRVHRRSFLRSARYDDDDPVEPDHTSSYPHVEFSLMLVPPSHPSYRPCTHPFQQAGEQRSHHPRGITSSHHLSGSSLFLHQLPIPKHFTSPDQTPYMCTSHTRRAYLSVKLMHQPAMDLVLVASPNGPHLRLLKQSMALVVFSLRPIDRLAIVTYSSAAARVFPLRRMTSYGKRTALQVIDRLFYMGQADPIEGLKKGMKILEDRVHKNPQSSILHLSDCPMRSYHSVNVEMSIPIHRFHVGLGFGSSNGFAMHEFEEFLGRLLGGVIRELQLRIGEDGRIIRLGELRSGEEKRILLELCEEEHVYVQYSYAEGGADECIRTGETLVSLEDKGERRDSTDSAVRDMSIGGRNSSVESWDYHDPFMARRWAKHLHGYRM